MIRSGSALGPLLAPPALRVAAASVPRHGRTLLTHGVHVCFSQDGGMAWAAWAKSTSQAPFKLLPDWNRESLHPCQRAVGPGPPVVLTSGVSRAQRPGSHVQGPSCTPELSPMNKGTDPCSGLFQTGLRSPSGHLTSTRGSGRHQGNAVPGLFPLQNFPTSTVMMVVMTSRAWD